MKKFALTTALILGAASVAACTTSATDLPEGEYEKTTESKDASGTAYKTTTKTNVTRDADGRKSATVEETNTKDPKGLFNKTTTESKTTVKQK